VNSAHLLRFPSRRSFAGALLFAVFAIAIAAMSPRLFAQTFPNFGDMNDFSDVMVETPGTAMVIEPSDALDPDADENVPGNPPAEPAPDELDTAGTNFEGPVGVTGDFKGLITTAGAYSPLNHNAYREVTDLVVPGSIGKYPLKMTRYYNSRQLGLTGLGLGWRYEYAGWGVSNSGGKVSYPNGNVWDTSCDEQQPVGTSDYWETHTSAGNGRFRLADGGTVVFENFRAIQIIDPYGQTTVLAYAGDGSWMTVTEPGGRYLKFIYGAWQVNQTTRLLTRVEAHALGNATVTDSVDYSYAERSPGGHGTALKCLIGVTYSDNTSASYEYRTDNIQENLQQGIIKTLPLLSTCNDVRYNGPMRQIAYEYYDPAPHGELHKEKCTTTGVGLVSKIAPALGYNLDDPSFTETRGDGPTRTFNYTLRQRVIRTPDDPCGQVSTPERPAHQMLLNYTDFQGHTTWFHYNTNWYVDQATDANGNTTLYTRGPPPPNGIGEILTITHPGNTGSIQYTYSDHGHYIMSVRDENNKTTTLTRDGNHRITRIDYPQDANTPASYETFTYNSFGQVLTHRMKNGAYESSVYDNRGLLIDKYNPKFGAIPGGTDPHTHYEYYTAADGKPGWIDRVKTMIGPAPNWQWSAQASETYEYDRKADGTPCAGRGLITKITHADNKYQSFRYNQYGNKVNEWNEMGERTEYAYDNYNRVTTVTKYMYGPPNEVTSYRYRPTNGNGTSPYLHTTNNPDMITAPTGIVTSNVYDQNFRKTSTTVAGRTTSFGYDNVGNPTTVTDPLNHSTTTDYDTRNRKWHVWDAQNHQTTFGYDNASNVTSILRPDGTTETKTYDALNRVLTDTVPKTNTVNIVTTFHYNPSGTLQWVKDGENHQTTFEYNAADQKTRMTYPDGSFQRLDYEDAHNMKSRTTVGGKVQDFAYDNRNRQWGKAWENAEDEWVILAFDGASRVRRARNGGWDANGDPTITSDIHRDYDHAGRLILDQQALTGLGTKNVNYEYDVVALRGGEGKPTRMYVTGEGYDYDFRYDDMGRFEKILPHGSTNPSFQYYYDNASNETQRHNYLNGVDQFYNPDSLNRMTTVDLKRNGSRFALESYDYYPIGRLHTVTRGNKQDQFGYYLDGELYWVMYGVSAVSAPDPNETPPAEDPNKEKTVDDFLSLSGWDPNQALTADRTVNYDLNNAGNRNSVSDSVTGTTAYQPNNLNQYINNVGSDPISNGPYHEIASYKNIEYTYIKDERLILAMNSATGNNYWLAYDGLGRCVARTVHIEQEDPLRATPTPRPSPTPGPRPSPGPGDPIKYYIYDGEKPILEYDANGGLVGKNLYGKGVDEILMRYDPTLLQNQTFYYQQDHEGSVTHLTDGSGNVIEKYRYDVFGMPTIYAPDDTLRTASIVSNRFLFTGREYSALFGFYEYRARAYHPGLGRFMSEDPKLFDAGDYNLFRYCHNDPIDNVDPMGLTAYETSGQHMTPEQQQAMDRAYNYIMAALQMSPRANLEGGTIAAGMAGQALMREARREAQKISEGRESRASYFDTQRQPGQPGYGPGLVPVNDQQIAYGKAGADQMGELTRGSMEANAAIIYNVDTGRYGYTGYVKSHPVAGSGQEALTPALPPGHWVYAGQVHAHHDNRPLSRSDFAWANTMHLPIFVKTHGTSMYVPPAAAVSASNLANPVGGLFYPGQF
jgi:RHS repeat-associated protein